VWAREAGARQPLTSAIWRSASKEWWFQIEQSDVVSFHSYGPADRVEERVRALRAFGKPLVCTEFLARPLGSTRNPVLGVLRERGVSAYCWGLVAGKTQTWYAWDTWDRPHDNSTGTEPRVWFHDLLRDDGSPFDPAELAYVSAIASPLTPTPLSTEYRLACQ
jgi:hypothetical protein